MTARRATHRGAWRTWRRLAVAAALAATIVGCQSVRSWEQGCPGVYSGVKYYGETLPESSWDEAIAASIDLPLSALIDTLALPFTSFAKPKEGPGGFPLGCKWAGE